MENHKRLKEYKKNEDLESVLRNLEIILAKAEADATPSYSCGKHPIIFIMGCARSGSTLLHQFLASTSNYAYPTNLLSRFYYAPHIGCLIQKALYDLDDKGELLGGLKREPDFSSTLGKTNGPMAPHEFWYFWRRFFKFGELQHLDNNALQEVNSEMFASQLYDMTYAFDLPLVLKGMIMNWNIPYLHEVVKNAFFIHIRRNTKFNAQSLLKARIDFFGSKEEWYSFKPPEYPQIKSCTAEEQVVRQVITTNNAISQGISEIPKNFSMDVDYEEFCRNPDSFLRDLHSKLGLPILPETGVKFNSSEHIGVGHESWELIQQYSEEHCSQTENG